MHIRNLPCLAASLITVTLIGLSGCGGGSSSGTATTTTAADAAVSSAQTTGTVPTSPTDVVAVGGTNKATISWSAVNGAASYTIYWSTAAGGTTTTGTGVVSATTSYIQRGLLPATRYYYLVTARNNSGESAASGEIATTTALLDGATPYATYCATCHGRLEISLVTNRGIAEIKAALQNISSMSGLVVTDAQISAISAALMFNN